MINTTAARAAGLTCINHIETVRLLASGPETMTAVAERLGISTAGVTHLADKLEKLGILTRIRGTKDRRAIWLRLTPEGLALDGRLILPELATA